MTPATVAGIAEKAIWAKLTDTKASALPQGNNVDARIAALIFAMLVPADVIPLIFVELQREVVNFFARQLAQFVLERNDFLRSLRERNHAD